MSVPRRLAERNVFLVMLGCFLAWTAVTVTGTLTSFDNSIRAAPIAARSTAGQIAEGFALVTDPLPLFSVTLLLALWAVKRRLRRLALALALSFLGLPAYLAVRTLCAQPRPSSNFSDSISASGFGYPSGHVEVATILTWLTVAVANAQREATLTRVRRCALGLLLVAAVAAGQWAMSTEWESGLVGGALLGATVVSGALWISGVDIIRRSLVLGKMSPAPVDKRAAIIYNPTKVLDLNLFRRRVEYALMRSGWKPPLWLETTRDEPGGQLAQDAAAQGVDLVLVAGGDGTVRTVCAGLAGSGVPVGLVPAGTGNLLCRNLAIPLDEDLALDVALNGAATAIDLIRCTTDTGSDTFAVMSGLGLDAMIMSETSARLKKTIRSGAYVLVAAQQLRSKPFQVRVTVDGKELTQQTSVMVLVGNVGKLQGGIEMFPDADVGDGRLDVLVASPDGLREWAGIATSVRSGAPTRGLERARGQRVEIVVQPAIAYQFDGDTLGETTRFVAEVLPGALLVMLPTRRPLPGRSTTRR